MSFEERLNVSENLYYAWRKAKRMYRMHDGYLDQTEIAEFELDLENRLKRIHLSLSKGTYRLSKLLPAPRPKKIEEDKSISRQYYHIPIDDQVAWLAVVNALGPDLDHKMPAWSYGNRLYRPAWYEKREARKSVLERGPYRHESGHLYKKFKHSWPFYRRHITFSAKAMVQKFEVDELDKTDQLAAASGEAEGLQYLNSEFWHKPEGYTGHDLYCASIDLKQFFPALSTKVVLNNILNQLPGADRTFAQRLLTNMLNFQLDKSGVPDVVIENVEPKFGGKRVKGLPTGLFASGFLANAAMLPIDLAVEEKIAIEKNIAHFRFVDDHTFIAYSFESLCDWIKWYKTLVGTHCKGVEINEKKFDPESLGSYLHASNRKSISKPSPRFLKLQKQAIQDTKIDGANPTKLLTKTLGQVSAIAATNADILDDNDLKERLHLLEWLLLADIPDREIRADTRAAFAAGQIARLTPILMQEADGLVDANRALFKLLSEKPKGPNVTSDEIANHEIEANKLRISVSTLQADHHKSESERLKHCYQLLLQAFKQYPNKARLFYRLLQYCRLTGHRGIRDIGDWIKTIRDQGHTIWGDYFCGLALQILADAILKCTATLQDRHALRSDQLAAQLHLEDIVAIRYEHFSVPEKRETWYYKVARNEFAISALSASAVLNENVGYKSIGPALENLASNYLSISFKSTSVEWQNKTGRVNGIWAHHTEPYLSVNGIPSRTWSLLEASMDYSSIFNRLAVRRYPKYLSDRAWSAYAHSKVPPADDDSGWILEAINGNSKRITEAAKSKRIALNRAARNISNPPSDYLTVSDWTEIIARECSPFDPRRSEWTALEITRQVIHGSDQDIGPDGFADRIHPGNVLIPKIWIDKFKLDKKFAAMSWKHWHNFVAENANKIHIAPSEKSISDYRYYSYSAGALAINPNEQNLTAVARLLLGLLKLDHCAPIIWNMRGNERAVPFPIGQILRSLAISSPTLLILEACIGGRSIENRAIKRQPDLFGSTLEKDTKAYRFDPPLLLNKEDRELAIEQAQQILEQNQLSVSQNQPRQLIPFRLSDFARAPAEGVLDDIDIE